MTLNCLGKISDEELQELCAMARSAGFGLGHLRALRQLCLIAQADVPKEGAVADGADNAPEASDSSFLSPKLASQLSCKGLQRLAPVLRQCGVQSVACLARLDGSDLQELQEAFRAAGFRLGHIHALRDLFREASGSGERREPTSAGDAGAAAPESPSSGDEEALAVASKRRAPGPSTSPSWECCVNACTAFVGREGEDVARFVSQEPPAKRARPQPKVGTPTKASPGSGGQSSPEMQRRASSKETPPASEIFEPSLRVPRQDVDDIVLKLKAMATEIVKYRCRVSGRMLSARIPVAVMALLKLRAACGGKEKEMSDQRLARAAVDLMEEQAYDPVRAIASLSPATLLCPGSAMRVLGSGCSGTAFLEESTNAVWKVMLEDFAPQEYKVFTAFAKAGLAPQPMSIAGPQVTPGGGLFCIRMGRITQTLRGVLLSRAPRGPRRGFEPPTEQTAQKIGAAVATALRQLGNNGLVHGDLHLENIGLENIDEQPSVQFIDFGRAAKCAAMDTGDGLVAGHEYDCFRLVGELGDSFDELQDEFAVTVKECEKELRELKSSREVMDVGAKAAAHQLHHARQIAGLQAYLFDEPKALEKVETAYNIVLKAIIRYSCSKYDVSFVGAPSVRNRRMRQAATRRQRVVESGYFKSDLFWGGSSGE